MGKVGHHGRQITAGLDARRRSQDVKKNGGLPSGGVIPGRRAVGRQEAKSPCTGSGHKGRDGWEAR